MDFIKECLNQLKMRLRLDTAIADKLEDHDKQLYALQEYRKLRDQALLDHGKRIGELELMVRKSSAAEDETIVELLRRVYALEMKAEKS